MTTQNVKIGFSFSLMGAVLLQGALLGMIALTAVAVGHLSMYASRNTDCSAMCGQDCPCGENCQCTPGNCRCQAEVKVPSLVKPKAKFEESHASIPLPGVNEAARAELKQGCPGGNCYRPQVQPLYQPLYQPTYQPQRHPLNVVADQYRAKVQVKNGQFFCGLPPGYVWIATGERGTHASSDTQAVVNEMRQGVRRAPNNVAGTPQVPQPERIGPMDQPSQQSNRLQITLFLLKNDPKSEMLKTWFMAHPTLAHWRSNGSYQEYYPDNSLYQTMTSRGRKLSDEVPVSAFPTVVFAGHDGGHIHAAGRDMIPDSPETLVQDVWRGMELKSDVPNGSGLLHTSGYSWDAAISGGPFNPNCPDGNCPYQPNPNCPDGNCPYPYGPNPNVNPYDSGSNYPGGVDNPNAWRPGKHLRDLLARPSSKTGIARDAIWGWLDIVVGALIAFGVLATIAFVVVFVGTLVFFMFMFRK